MNIGIDYDFPSMNMVCAKLEPLVWLVKHKNWKVEKVQAFISPSGKGWHIRIQIMSGWFCNGPNEFEQRAYELMAGDDPWRHAYSMARGEMPHETPLFEVKCKGKTIGKEQYHRKFSKRIREMFGTV